MLVPEISLTPQMVNRFLARFGEQIAVLHSKLSIGERFDEWQKIKNEKVKIVIGARSAIFAPIKNLGVIIIDEEHDMSYKSEMTPRYNAKEIAKYIAKNSNCPLVLGSATPDITSFYQAEIGEINLYKLTERANNSKLPSPFLPGYGKPFEHPGKHRKPLTGLRAEKGRGIHFPRPSASHFTFMALWGHISWQQKQRMQFL